ncbi:UNVERIFIED_CONTAM: protein SODIUM POTASSIUM ROOT defective [Sesamum radiatum]|uniref:Protein SODIUM POTASSIUM ROOT defective n=1 Tax=Sesamum radiatum TaxID=300843 RepID=A0AAW2R2L6_SESRA
MTTLPKKKKRRKNPLILPTTSAPKLKDVIAAPPTPTLAFQLKPKMVVLRVSMHCNGCARKVEKHISKLEGVTSYQVDLETKMVVVVGDIVPVEVLESVSKVKNAQLWTKEF